MKRLTNKLEILHLDLSISGTNIVYNEYCLPTHEKYNVSICTYFKSEFTPKKSISLFEGDGSFKGFISVLKRIFAAKEYDVIHIHAQQMGFLYLIALPFFPKYIISRTVFTPHNCYMNFKLRNRLFLYPCFAAFKKIITCGKASYESFPGFLKWLAKGKLSCIPNGTNVKRIDNFYAKNGRGPKYKKFTAVTAGALIPRKNPLTMVKAFHKSGIKNSNLIFMGKGYMDEAIIAESKALGCSENIILTGVVPRHDVYATFARADLFVFTTRGEGLPIAGLEAMACGCPVLFSDIKPHREIVGDLDFIPLVHPEDIDGFAREIKRFAEMTPGERKEIGDKCRKLVLEKFDVAIMQKRYAKVYAEIIKRKDVEIEALEPIPLHLAKIS